MYKARIAGNPTPFSLPFPWDKKTIYLVSSVELLETRDSGALAPLAGERFNMADKKIIDLVSSFNNLYKIIYLVSSVNNLYKIIYLVSSVNNLYQIIYLVSSVNNLFKIIDLVSSVELLEKCDADCCSYITGSREIQYGGQKDDLACLLG